MGFIKHKRPEIVPGLRLSRVAAASSHGSSIGWNAITTIAAATSAGAVVTQNTLLANCKLGDVAIVVPTVPTSSAGVALRLPATSAFFEGSTGQFDSIVLTQSLQSVMIVCLSSTRFAAIGAVGALATSAGGPVLAGQFAAST